MFTKELRVLTVWIIGIHIFDILLYLCIYVQQSIVTEHSIKLPNEVATSLADSFSEKQFVHIINSCIIYLVDNTYLVDLPVATLKIGRYGLSFSK